MRWSLIGCLFLAASCSDGPTDPNPPVIQLSAQQAATIVARAEQMATAHPDLAWLADSIQLVVRTGASAKRIVVTSEGEEIAYYGVGLQRNVITSTSAFSTWYLFAFDDASNPSDFIIANGFASASGTTAPTTVNGPFGGDIAHGHFIAMDGSIKDWRAVSGGATFRTATSGGSCPAVGTLPTGVTCTQSDLEVSFDIVSTTVPSGEQSRSANLLATTVPGVLLRIEQ